MERHGPKGPAPKQFARIVPETLQPPNESGERAAMARLDLDLAEFLQEEPITKRMNYVESVAQLRRIISGSTLVRPVIFDKDEFGSSLVSLGMYMQEKNERDPYYVADDSIGNQYRVYVNPQGRIAQPNLDYRKRIVLLSGQDTYYILPIVFTDKRRE
jgi:hypothetical protein